MVMSKVDTCKNCVFFHPFIGIPRHGKCKRYPPTVYACDEDFSTNTTQPMVDDDDWCGEHLRDSYLIKKGGEDVGSD
jgi:hypothetical protein